MRVGFRPGFGGFRPGFGARGFFPGLLYGSLLGSAVAPQYYYPPYPYPYGNFLLPILTENQNKGIVLKKGQSLCFIVKERWNKSTSS